MHPQNHDRSDRRRGHGRCAFSEHATKSRLRGKKVAVLVADGFEWIELSVPMKA